jgi:hypothetical protein
LKVQEIIREMIKKAIFACYKYYYNYHHYNYHTNPFTELRGNLSKTKRRYVHANCENSESQELIWVLSWNFHRKLKGEDHEGKTPMPSQGQRIIYTLLKNIQMNVHCQFNIHILIFSNQNVNII